MKDSIETIYILENPEKNIVKFATDYQVRYEDIIKDVFGVACISDLHMMLQFNKGFQESICKRNGIMENKITLKCVIRIASKEDLLQLKKQLTEEPSSGSSASSVSRPFDAVIQLSDGIFQWDDAHSAYIPYQQGA
ncbi:hypothetical protein [Neobacillus muris]|uniref:hypothetical protein n=1 Tax=Neobacillus muris TaxID=2941334 RepID=UPI0020422B92|nr:hypothetical protein [Neobacillus muris]